MQCRAVYRFKLEPPAPQALELEPTASVRFVCNWALDRCQMHHQVTGQSKPWGELSAELSQLKQAQKWLYDFFPLAPTGKIRQHNFLASSGAFWRF